MIAEVKSVVEVTDLSRRFGRTVALAGVNLLLEAVERVSDHVALLDRGRIVLCEPLETIKASHCRLTLRFDEPLASPPALLGSSRWEGSGREWSATWCGSLADLQGQAAGLGARIVDEHTPSLDEIFVARVGLRPTASMEA
jgi:ABC-2 type transport system ATP-binding protein